MAQATRKQMSNMIIDNQGKNVDAVLFDMGGVLTVDIWETVFFEPNHGIVQHFELDPQEAEKVGSRTWSEFSLTPSHDLWVYDQELESKFWEKIIKQLGIDINTQEMIEYAHTVIKPNSAAMKMLSQLSSIDLVLGLATNNTPFWFCLQWEKLGLERYLERRNAFVSCNLGLLKEAPGGQFFKVCCERMDMNPSAVVLIDDREQSIMAAESIGIRGLRYNYGAKIDGLQFAQI